MVEVVRRAVLGQIRHAAFHRRMVLLPAEIHPAEEADGIPGASGGFRVDVSVGGAIVGLNGVEEGGCLLDRLRVDVEVGHVAALERHQLPADRRGVTGLLGGVAPAPTDRILGLHDEVEGQLRRDLEALVLRHRVALGEDDPGEALGVHIAPLVVVVGLAIPLDRHPGEERQPGFELPLVGPLLVRVAAAEEGEEGQRRSPATILRRARTAPLAALSLATGAFLEIEAPAPVGHLVLDEPLQPSFDGRLTLRAPAAGRHELVAHRGAGPATESTGGAANRADGGEHVGRGGGLGAEVGEFDRDRCRIDVFGRAHHLDVVDRHDIGHHHLVGGRFDDRQIVRERGVEVLEGVEGFRRPRHDHPGLLGRGRLADDERHREEHDDMDEETDGPCRGVLQQPAEQGGSRLSGRCDRERRIVRSRVGRHGVHPVSVEPVLLGAIRPRPRPDVSS